VSCFCPRNKSTIAKSLSVSPFILKCIILNNALKPGQRVSRFISTLFLEAECLERRKDEKNMRAGFADHNTLAT
jgi:hypothetical protein